MMLRALIALSPVALAPALLAFTTTPASAQSLLDYIFKPKNGQASKTPANPQGTVPQNLAIITPAQTTAITAQVAKPLQDKRIAADRAEAKALIEALLIVGSCAKSDAGWNSVNRLHMSPKTWDASAMFSMYSAIAKFKYHDTSRCLDVARIVDWSKPANNALSFRAYYIADDSGEAANQDFTLQKTSDGEWLIRDFSTASRS